MRDRHITGSRPSGTGPLEELAWTLTRARAKESWPWYVRRSASAWLGTKNYHLLKRLIDILLASLALPFVGIILAIPWIAVRLDSPGRAFFTQLRTGRGGDRFRMYKLRTMVINADALKSKYLGLNEMTYPDFKITNDPRITRVGRFLRRTSLDELPQILNILKGDMSFVGPRPTSFSADTYELWHTARLEAVPGLTGLWQVSGRSELDFNDRLRCDIAYLRHQCFSLDIRILIKTVACIFSGRGAT